MDHYSGFARTKLSGFVRTATAAEKAMWATVQKRKRSPVQKGPDL
jgi:hypothetical protein